jgi:hypothetical protein
MLELADALRGVQTSSRVAAIAGNRDCHRPSALRTWRIIYVL